VIADRAGRRFSIIDGDTVSHVITIKPDVDYGRPELIGVSTERRLMLGGGDGPARFESPWLAAHLRLVDIATGEVETVGAYDYLEDRDADRDNPFRNGFGDATVVAGQFVIGRADRSELTWIDPSGEVRRVIRWDEPRRPVSDSLWAAFESAFYEIEDRRRQFSGNTEEQSRQLLGRLRSNAKGPLPEFIRRPGGGLLGDQEGNVWMEDFGVDYRFPPSFRVVSADGAWLGRVRAPERFQLLAVGGGRVLGVHWDEFDVQTVAVYTIER
jgi:hypothetical protein